MLEIDIVTPVRKLGESIRAAGVKLPTANGEIEVLPGHTELLTLLGTGILSVSDGTKDRLFAISYGFAEVRGDRVRVLAETVEESSEIDKERAQRAQKKAQEALAGALTEDKFKKYQLKLQRSLVRQLVAV